MNSLHRSQQKYPIRNTQHNQPTPTETHSNQLSWINHPLARHRHHHSLDSPLSAQPISDQIQPPTTPADKPAKRSASLSSQSANKLTHPSPSSPPITYNHTPLINHHHHHPTTTTTTTTTIDQLTYPPPTQNPLPSKSKSKLSLVSAVPASVLKKDKPGLLSQEQKRANHIASEQKRRAAIRQGYSRLCLVVPALRTPIGAPGGGGGGMGRTSLLENGQEPSIASRRSEEDSPLEEELSLDQPPSQINNLSLEESANSTAFKRKRNKPPEINRAGTRSEAVVLAKTVEYLRELEVERKLFLDKLRRLKEVARSEGISLSAHKSHKQFQGQTHTEEDQYRGVGANEEEEEEPPLWECKWRGNIQEIDRHLQDQLSSISDRNHLNLNLFIRPNLSPPIPFDLASIHQDPHLFHSHHNNDNNSHLQQ